MSVVASSSPSASSSFRRLRGLEPRSIGQELHLQVVRELHLARHALFGDALAHEPIVLDRGSDLGRDRREELLVRGAEAAPVLPADEVHHADRARLALSG